MVSFGSQDQISLVAKVYSADLCSFHLFFFSECIVRIAPGLSSYLRFFIWSLGLPVLKLNVPKWDSKSSKTINYFQVWLCHILLTITMPQVANNNINLLKWHTKQACSPLSSKQLHSAGNRGCEYGNTKTPLLQISKYFWWYLKQQSHTLSLCCCHDHSCN